MLTVLVGGARSGKSSLAVELGLRHDGPVLFIATAEAFDDDLRARIARHREERPGWPTVETPVELASAVRASDDHTLVIIDCLTVWVGNLFHHRPDADQRHATYDELVDALRARRGPTIVVSNEVGLGLHPQTALGRDYRDELGRLNQRVVAAADQALLLVAGRALALTDPREILR